MPKRPSENETGSFDLRNSWQVVVGSILIPLGLVIILIGWYGSAHARVVQQQIPYLVSGGFIGLGCMVVGGLLYWGHWLYRQYDQAELHHEEQRILLETLIRSISGGALGTATSTTAGSDLHFATPQGSVYHQSGCPVIAHHATDLRTLGPADLDTLRPCQICTP
ncbi:MAG TPA: hypothetical protein VHV57_06340 [Acidimicrobiales bacterium]|jgi:hypothetical protein|nr:hypothetical protein [Acidimicrobiales bacterium]